MDPYIDPDALDPAHPFTARKLDNLARADVALREGRLVLDSLPSKLTLQTTDQCNLRCPHCQIPPERKTRSMDGGLLSLLGAQLLPDLIELHPTNLGEPFAWPHFQALCGMLFEHGVVLDLTTNGTLLDARRLEWIAPIARDIKVSFDGATAPTFERFRTGARFDRVCENVRRLTERLDRVRCRRPTVALQMTLMRDNYQELPQLVELAHQMGAHRVKAYHLFAFRDELREQSLMPTLEHYERVIRPRAEERAHQLGVDVQLAEVSGGTRDDLVWRTCFLPWHESWVDVDGSVLLCHSHEGQVLGSLDAFERAWNGPALQRVRRGLAERQPVGACAQCGMCWERERPDGRVPMDRDSFLGDAGSEGIRWSGRMRQFGLSGRREWAGGDR